MGAWQKAYTDDQRDAIEQAWGDRGIRPASRIQTLAADGELTRNGDLIPAFHIPETTIRTIGARYVRSCEGHIRSKLAVQPPGDAVEQLRQRLVNAVNTEIGRIERKQEKRQEVKGEQLRQVARAIREIAAIPGPNDTKRPVQPGQHDPEKGGKTSGATKGGLAGKILASAAQQTPVHNNPHTTDPQHTSNHNDTHTHTTIPDDPPTQPDDPGLYVREHIAALPR